MPFRTPPRTSATSPSLSCDNPSVISTIPNESNATVDAVGAVENTIETGCFSVPVGARLPGIEGASERTELVVTDLALPSVIRLSLVVAAMPVRANNAGVICLDTGLGTRDNEGPGVLLGTAEGENDDVGILVFVGRNDGFSENVGFLDCVGLVD